MFRKSEIDPLVSRGRGPSLNAVPACRGKFIAWCLRRPKRGSADENEHFLHLPCMDFDMCTALHIKMTLCQILPDGKYG